MLLCRGLQLAVFVGAVSATVTGPIVRSATWEVWQHKQKVEGQNRTAWLEKQGINLVNPVNAACMMMGTCDDPMTRNKARTDLLNISVSWTVIGSGDSLSRNRIEQQMEAVNDQWEQANVHFSLDEIDFISISGSQCLPAYSNNNQWYYKIQSWKSAYGRDAASRLNVYSSCQDRGTQGTLLGFGTFPWDSDATKAVGGIWMNSAYVSGTDTTLAHEIGHNLGLRHTFAGINEVSGCSDPCYEFVHSIGEASANFVGDWCADTRSTPLNYECANPGGNDCRGTPFGNTPYNNYMGYSADKCQTTFTDDQIFRAHCWVCEGIPSQANSGC